MKPTKKMIAAGVAVLRASCPPEPIEDLVSDIYQAMANIGPNPYEEEDRQRRERIAQIVAMWRGGAILRVVGAHFGITGSRVRGIVIREANGRYLEWAEEREALKRGLSEADLLRCEGYK